MTWFALSLLCAFSLASADAATKAWLQGYSARELALVRFAVTGILLLPLLLTLPLRQPDPRFWLWFAGLAPLEVLAMLLYMKAIRDHPLSLTVPYLAFTPVFVVLTGWLVLGETISTAGMGGILLVVAGGWLLNLEQARLGDWRGWLYPLQAILHQRGARVMLAVAAIFSLTSVMGKGALRYTTPETMGALYYLVIGLIVAVLFSLRDPGLVRRSLRRPWAVLAVAALNGLMVITHFLAISLVEVAYMIAVKRTSLLFGILYGALLFGESGLGKRLPAGALMAAGTFMIMTGE